VVIRCKVRIKKLVPCLQRGRGFNDFINIQGFEVKDVPGIVHRHHSPHQSPLSVIGQA
jgi:hypothetical protein